MKPSVRTILQASLFVVLAVFCIYLCPRPQNPFGYKYEVGQSWKYKLLTAEFDFPIYRTEAQIEEERQEAMTAFSPCYKSIEGAQIIGDVYILSQKDFTLLEGTKYPSIVIDGVPKYTKKIKIKVASNLLEPNISYDSIASAEQANKLVEDVSPTYGVVKQGDKIVDYGEIVTPEVAQKLESMRRAMESMQVDEKSARKQSIFYIIGISLCTIVPLLLFFFFLITYRPKLLEDFRHVLFFTILLGAIIAMTFLMLKYVPVEFVYLIPFAWCPIITRVFYDSSIAIFLHIITVLVTSVAVPDPYIFLFIQLLAGVIGVVSLRDMTQRSQLAQTAAFILLSYGIVYTAAIMVTTGGVADIEWKYYIYFVINAIFVICAYGLIFLFERFFGLVSDITLVELTNVNSGLMVQFAEKAPGTFQHSLQVSNLATEAAKRIGAKVLLVRTGALYHDIGKMSHPEYFIENQSGYNPLQAMSYADAAKVIINHVTDGERIARKHRLPEQIIHFIRSHHGTSVTRYFYNSAVNKVREAGGTITDVRKADYTYPGPKPTSKEAAILMMADAIEARSRSLSSLTEQSISDMVNQMIDAQIQDGQFSETPLTFRDLEEVRAVFKQKLIEMNHHRISYPTLNNK
jgi:putative nucleotidyltransferase with HDIG domain